MRTERTQQPLQTSPGGGDTTNTFMERATSWLNGKRDIEEGLELCRRLPEAKLFVEYVNCYSADNKMTEIVRLLEPYRIACPSLPPQGEGMPPSPNAQHPTPNTQEAANVKMVTSAGTVYELTPEGDIVSVGGARPSHYDEWVHMMPEEMQKKVATIKENFTIMAQYRQQLKALIARPDASKSDISRLARLIRTYEAKNLNIFAQADVCWDELSGKKVSNETKAELIAEERKLSKEPQDQPLTTSPGGGVATNTQYPTPNTQDLSDEVLAKMTCQQLEAIPEEQMTEGQKKYWIQRRLETCRKYLRGKLPENPTEKQKKKAQEYINEILASGGKISEKVAERLKQAGLQLTINN